jgi:hypothetical protein
LRNPDFRRLFGGGDQLAKKPAKVETSLLGAQVRMMGRTLTTTMWRDKNPVTGQARILTAPLNDLP